MKTLLLFISLFIIAADAATVRLYFTDPLTNEKDTNAFYITPVGTNVLSNGGVVGRGVTTRHVPASNGYRTNTLAVGHYSITNRSLGSGVVIRVPETSSLYDYTNLLISGYNTFVTINNYTNSNSGAAVSNVFGLTFALDTRYTNSTAYYAQISSSMTFTQQNSSDSAFYFFIDTNLDGTIDFRRTNWFHVNSGTTWSRTTFTETVPPGAAYGATNISNGTSTMTADALSGAIIYFSTNSASGTAQTNISYTAVTNLASFGALTNNDTRGITFLNGLTVHNNLEVSSISSGTGNLSLSPEASGNVVISVGQLVGNGGGLTNLTGAGSSIAAGTNIVTVTNGSLVTVHGTANVNQAGLAAGSYVLKGLTTGHGITFRTEYVNDGQFVGPNIYAGHPQNYIQANEPGCFIAGGITNTTSGAAYTNTILDRISTIAGGVGNWIGQNSEGSFIGAGEQNKIMDDCTHSVIVSGEINTIEGLAEWSGILSGHHVAIGNGAGYSVMLGGDSNTNNGAYSTMGGGEFNRNTGLHSVVMGGQSNVASGAYSQIVGGYLNSQSGHASSIIGNRVTNSLNGATVLGFHTNTLTVQSNGVVSTTGQFVGNGTGLTNMLNSYFIQAGGTVATLPDSAAILNFGTTDPSLIITNAGTYMIQAGATLQYNAWEPDINPSTVTIKMRRTSGSPDDIVGGNVSFDLATTGTAYTGPLSVVTTALVIYTSAGSETIQLWGDRGGDPTAGSIEARSAWITAVKIR